MRGKMNRIRLVSFFFPLVPIAANRPMYRDETPLSSYKTGT